MDTSNQTTILTTRMKLDMLIRLQEVAQAEERSVASMVRIAIQELLDRRGTEKECDPRICDICHTELESTDVCAYITKEEKRHFYHWNCVEGRIGIERLIEKQMND